jgi:hypothetical protein
MATSPSSSDGIGDALVLRRWRLLRVGRALLALQV